MIERRYQVFVSSTYADLSDERREVIQALLELDCIPAGMELFPAANDDQWTLIQQVIDDCDYYLVIVAGRYGSVDSSGVSFTEKEYRYALEKKKPIIGFVHAEIGNIPAKKVEGDPSARQKRDDFIDLVKQKPVRFWLTAEDLGSQVSRSLIKLIKAYPSPGWVRADNLPDESASQEILRLRKEIDRLNEELHTASVSQPSDSEVFAQSTDAFLVDVDVSWDTSIFDTRTEGWNATMHWNEIVFAVAPILIDAASSEAIREKLAEYIAASRREAFMGNAEIAQAEHFKVKVQPAALDTIIVQLNALGIIRKSGRNRSVNDKNTYWELTPYGEKLMYEVRAIRRRPEPLFDDSAARIGQAVTDEGGAALSAGTRDDKKQVEA